VILTIALTLAGAAALPCLHISANQSTPLTTICRRRWYVGHAFSNRTHFKTCSRFRLSSGWFSSEGRLP